MSKALDYLLEARPEAMKNYFGFLKQAGKHLDPKTRAIISVITKVDNQTETGFRQYLRRALQEGVSADEILDALLFAFPTLGLTKIIWAMDILLQMDLPDFHIENLDGEGQWHDVLGESELKPGAVVCAGVAGKAVFVFTSGDGITVYDSICPHQSTSLGESNLEGCTITCPRHNWEFDLKTGECIKIGNKPLTKLRHKMEGSRLLVYI